MPRGNPELFSGVYLSISLKLGVFQDQILMDHPFRVEIQISHGIFSFNGFYGFRTETTWIYPISTVGTIDKGLWPITL